MARLWICAVLLGVLGCGGPRLSVQDEGPPPPDLTVRPYGLTGVFLQHLRAENYAQAYAMLSSSLQREITIVRFKDSLSTWRLAYPRALETCIVRREQVFGERALTRFGPQEAEDPAVIWTLSMVQEQGEWRISRITGPAFPP